MKLLTILSMSVILIDLFPIKLSYDPQIINSDEILIQPIHYEQIKSKQKRRVKQPRQLLLASRSNEPDYPTSIYTVTAYTSGFESTQKTINDPAYGLTASGTHATEGRTIACPKSLQFGTIVDIRSVGIRVCEDRGGAITSKHIDLYIQNLKAAYEFGRKQLEIKIIRYGQG